MRKNYCTMRGTSLVVLVAASCCFSLGRALVAPSSASRRALFHGACIVASGLATSSLVGANSNFAAVAKDTEPKPNGLTGLTAASTFASPTTGAPAPKFSLPNSRGTSNVSLDELTASKKWTVLYFYPGAFTQGCTLEARAFQRDLDDYRRLNAQIVGVSVDPPEKNAQFCTAEGLDFYVLSDTGGRVSKLYGSALSIPGFGTFSNRQTYLIDPRGNLRWVFTDVESRIARHSGEVLEKLTELEQKA